MFLMKNIVVTGGAGYIGIHTIIELISKGYNPIIIDNLCNSSIDNIKGAEKITKKKIKWYKKDCTDGEIMENIFKNEKNIFAVIHFSAFKSVEESVRDPEKYYKNNVGSLEVILDCMKKYNVQNIIFSSSCTVYGNPDILPVDEKAIFKKAESPYGETKQICENIIAKNSFNSVSLRYFNPIGCHHTGLIGDCSYDKPNNLVPIITEVAIGKRKKIIIFGNDYKTNDGTCIRDYIHVCDLANSHVKALNFLNKNAGKHVFNIGTGKGLSVLNIVKKFEEVNKVKINYSIGPRRDGDIAEIYANGELAKNKLGWMSKKNIEESLISAWNWEKKKRKL